MSYQKHIVEDYNTVNVTFHIKINIHNEMYNNLILDVETTPSKLKRSDNEFWSRRKTTIVDALVMSLLLLSFWTYVLSIFKTSRLAKVSVFVTLCTFNLLI